MMLLSEVRKRARHIAGPVLGACLFGYFAYHAVQGDRGIFAWLKLTQQVQEARETLDSVSAEWGVFERRASVLRPDNLDPDMLSERARAVLGLAHPNDVVIYAIPRAPRR